MYGRGEENGKMNWRGEENIINSMGVQKKMGKRMVEICMGLGKRMVRFICVGKKIV